MSKKMSPKASSILITQMTVWVMGTVNGWLIMLGAGLLHSEVGTPTIGFFPTAFWLGIIFINLIRLSVPYNPPSQ